MIKGYVIIVRDYVAEVCEFTTLQIIDTPDGIKLYYVHTKYGDNYFKESELSPIRKPLLEQCEELNKELEKVRGKSIEGRKNKIH